MAWILNRVKRRPFCHVAQSRADTGPGDRTMGGRRDPARGPGKRTLLRRSSTGPVSNAAKPPDLGSDRRKCSVPQGRERESSASGTRLNPHFGQIRKRQSCRSFCRNTRGGRCGQRHDDLARATLMGWTERSLLCLLEQAIDNQDDDRPDNGYDQAAYVNPGDIPEADPR